MLILFVLLKLRDTDKIITDLFQMIRNSVLFAALTVTLLVGGQQVFERDRAEQVEHAKAFNEMV